ncbi:M48 family metallopeptidase [Aestuariibius sp. HNIBRBA575]|uniref:M48 family metallopeptidase n=1 Tax=Aestuariibius sp. HNIBRBA575 TaxID=3233343 RepID=UPI0034A421DB
MLRFAPIFIALIYGYAAFRFSMWRTARELDSKSSDLNDPVLNVHLADLARALDIPKIRVQIYEIDLINGLAASDGRIFITRGFYKKFQDGAITGAELASVIAHELGHVALGHSRRRMIGFAGQNAIRAAIMLMVPPVLRMVVPHLVSAAMSILGAKLSRNDEFEADAYASALLIKANIGTAPQIDLFHKLGALTGQKPTDDNAKSSLPAWLMTHPATKDRIKAIRSNEAKWVQSK